MGFWHTIQATVFMLPGSPTKVPRQQTLDQLNAAALRQEGTLASGRESDTRNSNDSHGLSHIRGYSSTNIRGDDSDDTNVIRSNSNCGLSNAVFSTLPYALSLDATPSYLKLKYDEAPCYPFINNETSIPSYSDDASGSFEKYVDPYYQPAFQFGQKRENQESYFSLALSGAYRPTIMSLADVNHHQSTGRSVIILPFEERNKKTAALGGHSGQTHAVAAGKVRVRRRSRALRPPFTPNKHHRRRSILGIPFSHHSFRRLFSVPPLDSSLLFFRHPPFSSSSSPPSFTLLSSSRKHPLEMLDESISKMMLLDHPELTPSASSLFSDPNTPSESEGSDVNYWRDLKRIYYHRPLLFQHPTNYTSSSSSSPSSPPEGEEESDLLLLQLEYYNQLLAADPKSPQIQSSQSMSQGLPFSKADTYWMELLTKANPVSLADIEKIVIEKGVPNHLRTLIWPLFSDLYADESRANGGSNRLKSRSPGNLTSDYDELKNKRSPYDPWILRDVSRTFPSCSFFADGGGDRALFSVLRAYSHMDPIVGYCQGLSFLLAILLLHLPPNESLQTLSSLMSSYQLRSLYTPGLEGLLLRLYQFRSLFKKALPDLYAHFMSLGLDENLYVSQWFLTLFSYRLPFGLVFRIMDWFLISGISVLFKVGLAILKSHQQSLLMLDFEGVLDWLKNSLSDYYSNDLREKELEVWMTAMNQELEGKKDPFNSSFSTSSVAQSRTFSWRSELMGEIGRKGSELLHMANHDFSFISVKSLAALKKDYEKSQKVKSIRLTKTPTDSFSSHPLAPSLTSSSLSSMPPTSELSSAPSSTSSSSSSSSLMTENGLLREHLNILSHKIESLDANVISPLEARVHDLSSQLEASQTRESELVDELAKVKLDLALRLEQEAKSPSMKSIQRFTFHLPGDEKENKLGVRSNKSNHYLESLSTDSLASNEATRRASFSK